MNSGAAIAGSAALNAGSFCSGAACRGAASVAAVVSSAVLESGPVRALLAAGALGLPRAPSAKAGAAASNGSEGAGCCDASAFDRVTFPGGADILTLGLAFSSRAAESNVVAFFSAAAFLTDLIAATSSSNGLVAGGASATIGAACCGIASAGIEPDAI